MINTKTNEFLQALVKLVNESGLPPVNVRIALELVRQQVIEAEKQEMEQEKEAGPPVPGEVPQTGKGD